VENKEEARIAAGGAPVEAVVGRHCGKAEKIDIDFTCSSIGRARSTGEIICLLLSLDRAQAEEIVADVINTMGLSLDEVAGWANDKLCPECGMSLHMHKENKGNCF